ncbi:hypothetical protein AYO47_03230 [Planctomyces sp. SCGC AG-212-M04]|nr:hypothetical protein AYO47_03230 [Planctomyces sp. SCGC AG-212-M04]
MTHQDLTDTGSLDRDAVESSGQKFERRSILSADEAHWFLDLQGFPRAGRTHRLAEADGVMLAVYEAMQAPGGSPVSAAFQLVEPSQIVPGTAPGIAPPALDAGQLLFLASAFAGNPVSSADPDPLRSHRALLADAIACTDAVLLRIPPGASCIPQACINSSEGRSFYDREPQRFRRDRLAAYRDGLIAELSRVDKSLASTSHEQPRPHPPGEVSGTTENPALATALLLDFVRAQALPILQAIASDTDGRVIASLEPRDADFEQVFILGAAEGARRRYRELWRGSMRVPRPSSAQSEIKVWAAPAGMLVDANDLSRPFPGGYLGVSRLFNPHRVWLAWKYLEPGTASGLSYDGLVWVVDHWAWFPKPFRVLADI